MSCYAWPLLSKWWIEVETCFLSPPSASASSLSPCARGSAFCVRGLSQKHSCIVFLQLQKIFMAWKAVTLDDLISVLWTHRQEREHPVESQYSNFICPSRHIYRCSVSQKCCCCLCWQCFYLCKQVWLWPSVLATLPDCAIALPMAGPASVSVSSFGHTMEWEDDCFKPFFWLQNSRMPYHHCPHTTPIMIGFSSVHRMDFFWGSWLHYSFCETMVYVFSANFFPLWIHVLLHFQRRQLHDFSVVLMAVKGTG